MREGNGIELLLVAAPIGIAVALLLGGSLRRIATLDLKHAWLVFASLVMQVAGIAALSGTGGSFGWVLTVATSLPLVAFFIVNRSVPGMFVVAIGFLLNLVVITLNRAMPVSPDAARAAGVPITREIQGPRHEVLTEHSLLPWLGDVVPLPPLDTVVSIGDVVLAAGVGYMLFRAALAPRDQGVRTASGSEPAAGL